jgi:BirA family biotin operon repressor/biotin-[acetyl-CoA-carboxylase] ligase
MADRLSELIRRDAQEGLREGWRCEIAGREIYCLVETSSTNHVALNLGRQGALEGTLVVADAQSAGRGRLGRAWLAPPGTSLLFSIIFRPPPGRPPFQTIMAVALGVARGIAAETGLVASLKWPNDVLLNGRKAGGLLAESEAQGALPEFMVVGVGLNVNFLARSVPGIPAEATSLLEASEREVDRCALLRRILQAVDEEYVQFRRGVSPYARWVEALATVGKEVVVELGRDQIRGRAERADESGALWVHEASGTQRRILAGDVTHLRTEG